MGAAWVEVAGELDLVGAPRLTGALRNALHDARLVLLDLSELTFMDSAGVHAIARPASTSAATVAVCS